MRSINPSRPPFISRLFQRVDLRPELSFLTYQNYADASSDGPDPHVEGQKGGNTSGGAGGDKYKPLEHGGMKQDATPDKRTSSEHGFGGS